MRTNKLYWTLKSGWISSSSPVIKNFENDWNQLHKSSKWLSVSNGTVALQLCMKAIGLDKNSKVGVLM